mmetsp:Transcript_45619/g.135057  ORF Transcript_45619/g.135057 Transcript_45619/m.135057 type:complete len:296 (+) Transcript_45619:1145-2032(+)
MSEAHARLVHAPCPVPRLAGHAEDHQGLAPAEVEGFGEARVSPVGADLVLPGVLMLPEGERRHPVGRVDGHASEPQVRLQALHQVGHRPSPPMDDAESRDLLHLRHELHEGTPPLLRGRQDDPGVGMVDVEVLHLQRLAREDRQLRRGLVLPVRAVLHRVALHPLELSIRNASLLNLIDIALEPEGPLHALDVVLNLLLDLAHRRRPGSKLGPSLLEDDVVPRSLLRRSRLAQEHFDLVVVVLRDRSAVDVRDCPSGPHAVHPRLRCARDDLRTVHNHASISGDEVDLHKRGLVD